MMKLFQGADPDQLVKSLLALVFFGAGLLLSFLLGKIFTLSCHRADNADRCVLRVTWLGLTTIKETHIEGLQAAQVEESCDEDGCTYRVVLVTTLQPLPLTDFYSSGESEKQILADKINDFAGNREIRDLEIRQGGDLLLIVPIVFLAAAIWLASQPLTSALRTLFPKQS